MLNDILTLDQQWLLNRSDFPQIPWPWYRAWPSPNYEWFPWSFCNGFGMPAGNAYPSGHLVPSPLSRGGGGLACTLIVDQFFSTLHRFNDHTEIDFYRIERFSWSICDGCIMPAGSSYPSSHLVLSSFFVLACAPIVETRFLELAVSLLHFSPWILLGTF